MIRRVDITSKPISKIPTEIHIELWRRCVVEGCLLSITNCRSDKISFWLTEYSCCLRITISTSVTIRNC